MARNVSLGSLVDQVRAEAGHSLNPAQGRQVRDALVSILQRTQEVLWDDYDWPHLRVFRNIPLCAGQRYYDPPADVKIDRIIKVEVRFGLQLMELSTNLSGADYSMFNSDIGIRSWPVQKWLIVENEQFEIWPIPAQNGDTTMLGAAPAYPLLSNTASPGSLEGVLRVTGIRSLRKLADDSDTCDLDGRLLVLFTAAEILARDGAPEAKQKLQEANVFYSRLKGRSDKATMFVLGGGTPTAAQAGPRGPLRVAYRTGG